MHFCPNTSLAPKVFLLSAPSGSGKTSLVNAVMPALPELKRAITHTTRAPRVGFEEKNGVDYHFVSDEEFQQGIDQGAFIEWQNIYHYKYGTSFAAVEKVRQENKHVLLVIDVDGTKAIAEQKILPIFSIFLYVPDTVELEKRLKARNSDSQAELEVRLARYRTEAACRYCFDCVILNDDFEKAKHNFTTLVRAFPL